MQPSSSPLRLLPLLAAFLLPFLASSAPSAAAAAPAAAADANGTSWWRPLLHYTPAANWINDPNGLVYDPVHRLYHLFSQYNPTGAEWGDMSWGHAVSADLVSWVELPVAIPNDGVVAIFSGSAVVDTNTSGLCRADTRQPSCLVAVYAGNSNIQTVNVASSVDRSWAVYEKYAGNPVINPGLANFRDPSVFWYDAATRTRRQSPPAHHSAAAPAGYWVAVVARTDLLQVELYRSDDLLRWTHMSTFGPDGTVDGWECPDLFHLPTASGSGSGSSSGGQWVLLVSARTPRYFVGDFDGKSFTALPSQGAVQLDNGFDHYAPITFFSTPHDGVVLIGWMVNWAYAAAIPTQPWRGQYTIPRSLSLHAYTVAGATTYRVLQQPVAELASYRLQHYSLPGAVALSADGSAAARDVVAGRLNYTGGDALELQACFGYPAKGAADVAVALYLRSTADRSQATVVGFNVSASTAAPALTAYVDRRRSGVVDFAAGFASVDAAVVSVGALAAVNASAWCVQVLLDSSSVELFVQSGYAVVTSQIFPTHGADNHGLYLDVLQGQVDLLSLDVWDYEAKAAAAATTAAAVAARPTTAAAASSRHPRQSLRAQKAAAAAGKQ